MASGKKKQETRNKKPSTLEQRGGKGYNAS